MFRDKFSDTFYAGFSTYFMVHIFEKVYPKFSIFIFNVNLTIMAAAVQHRCYGLSDLLG